MAAKNRHNHIDCLAAALPDEEYFVFLARDPAMPALLGMWASLRVGNFAAAAANFEALMTPELVQHYLRHPDHAKSQEAVETANRAVEWREANVGGPNGVPTWKKSLVRPQMLTLVANDEPAERFEGKHPALGMPYGKPPVEHGLDQEDCD